MNGTTVKAAIPEGFARLEVAVLLSVLLFAWLAVGASPASADWVEVHISRKGASTWMPNRVKPASHAGSNFHRLESDLTFTSHSHRLSGHKRIQQFSDHVHLPSFEWQFDLFTPWSGSYASFFMCDLPSCERDTQEFDSNIKSYAAISGTPQDIVPGTYHVDIGVNRGGGSGSPVRLHANAGAYSSSCPHWPSVTNCSFENYRVWYNKIREHPAPGSYPTYRGGSYAWQRDSADPTCGGTGSSYWRESYGNLKIHCTGLGPERPGTVWAVPPSSANSTRIYKHPPTGFAGLQGDNFSVEALLRCDDGVKGTGEDSSCLIRLGHQFKVGGSVVQNQYGPLQTIPNNGKWYLCRYDTSRYGRAPAASRSFDGMIPVVHVRDDTQPHLNELYVDNLIMFGYQSYGPGSSSVDSRTCNTV